jgi:hypothetical protein
VPERGLVGTLTESPNIKGREWRSLTCIQCEDRILEKSYIPEPQKHWSRSTRRATPPRSGNEGRKVEKSDCNTEYPLARTASELKANVMWE